VDQSGGSTAHAAAPLIILGLLLGSTLFGEELSELSVHFFFNPLCRAIAWVEAMKVDQKLPEAHKTETQRLFAKAPQTKPPPFVSSSSGVEG